MERKLATIQRITNLTAIEGADQIVRADILGWHLVVGKDDFKVGDLCIFCEIDSVLPEKPEFEFLKARCWVDNGVVKGYRIRTVRLRKQISQGIAFPVSLLKRYFPKWYKFKEGLDVTAILGVVKYEQPVRMQRPAKPKTFWAKLKWYFNWYILKRRFRFKAFPKFFPKTDEERCQNIPEVLVEKNGTVCYYSEKLDGVSTSFYYYKKKFGVAQRNFEVPRLKDSDFGHWAIAKKYDLESKLKKLNKNIAIQGELVGPGLQGNKFNLAEKKLFVFNIFDIDRQKYLDYKEFIEYCSILELETVPILDENFVLNNLTVDQLVELAKGKSTLAAIEREGIVIRALVDDYTTLNTPWSRMSFKAINPEFLLKYGE